jgi:hypothetical protein
MFKSLSTSLMLAHGIRLRRTGNTPHPAREKAGA